MKFNFRQGIHHSPMTSGHPAFLTYNPGNNTITVTVGVDLVRATAAYEDHNYLIEEREDSVDRWGPFNWNLAWGPAPTGNYSVYLYWDINRSTGLLSHGFTPHPQIIELTQPTSPLKDQHWFDTTTNVMKVWDGSIWRKVIRVFAGSFITGTSTIIENDLGSQVGIETSSNNQNDWYDHGYIIFGADQRGIRFNDTNFVTTATQIMTYHGTFSSPIQLETLNSTVLADEPIPAFYAISNTGAGTVQLASGTVISRRPVGITLAPANPGDPVNIVTKGIVYNDQWNWNVSSGQKDIYCGNTGQLVQGEVNFTNGIARLGTILGPQTVLIDVDLYSMGSGGLTDDSLFVFQVGIPGSEHQHFATMLRSEAEYLILNTTSDQVVGDIMQPSVILITEPNGNTGDPNHTHAITVYHDYANHTFIVSDISNNSMDNHEAFVVGDGAGEGGPAAEVQNTQIFSLTSMNDGYFNDQAVDTWNFQEPNGYIQPTYISERQVYNGGTEFVIQEPATYEMRCSVKSTCTDGFPETVDDDFVYRLVVSAPQPLTEMETIHQRPQRRTYLGNNSFSWTDIFRFSGTVDSVVTISAYIVSYYNTSKSNSYIIDVSIEKIGTYIEPI